MAEVNERRRDYESRWLKSGFDLSATDKLGFAPTVDRAHVHDSLATTLH